MDTTPILRPSAAGASLPLGLAAPASGLAGSNGDFAGIFRQLWPLAQRPESGASERRAVTAPEDLESFGDAAGAEHADPAKVIPADAGLDTERQVSVAEPPERSGQAPGRAPPPVRFVTVCREDGWTQQEKAPIGVPTAEISSRMLGPERQDIAAPLQAAGGGGGAGDAASCTGNRSGTTTVARPEPCSASDVVNVFPKACATSSATVDQIGTGTDGAVRGGDDY